MAIPILAMSAIQPEQAPSLRRELRRMIDALVVSPASDGITISRERHRAALAAALRALEQARDATLAGLPPEIVAVEVMTAGDALGAVTGEVSSEDILDAIFTNSASANEQ